MLCMSREGLFAQHGLKWWLRRAGSGERIGECKGPPPKRTERLAAAAMNRVLKNTGDAKLAMQKLISLALGEARRARALRSQSL